IAFGSAARAEVERVGQRPSGAEPLRGGDVHRQIAERHRLGMGFPRELVLRDTLEHPAGGLRLVVVLLQQRIDFRHDILLSGGLTDPKSYNRCPMLQCWPRSDSPGATARSPR